MRASNPSGIQEFSRPVLALAEMRRVLRIGGTALLIDMRRAAFFSGARSRESERIGTGAKRRLRRSRAEACGEKCRSDSDQAMITAVIMLTARQPTSMGLLRNVGKCKRTPARPTQPEFLVGSAVYHHQGRDGTPTALSDSPPPRAQKNGPDTPCDIEAKFCSCRVRADRHDKGDENGQVVRREDSGPRSSAAESDAQHRNAAKF